MQTSSNINSREIVIALTGNPNSGKTSVFNHLTGSNQHVGNWSGVTVERLDGWLHYGKHKMRITDLPGMYSLSAGSPDEVITRDFIVHGVGSEGRPDVVVQVIDGGSLERSLLLTMQLIEQEIPMVIALNMWDEVQSRGLLIDPDKLSEKLGIRVIPTVGNRGEGIDELIEAILTVSEEKEPSETMHIRFDQATEHVVEEIISACKKVAKPISRGFALGILTSEEDALDTLNPELRMEVTEIIHLHKPQHGASWSEAVTHARYSAISKLLTKVIGSSVGYLGDTLTSRIDRVLINRFWGLPIFILLLLMLFEVTFTVGVYPMEWIDAVISWLADLAKNNLPAGFINGFVADGIISGAGFILVFLPNIVILLMGIHLLEDSGYMARAAFIMDRVMRLMGLHGRAFIPLLMGFGCSVPAIMASRTLENRRDRILTILVTPLMSCSARLPIYVMVAAAFFPRHGGFLIFSLYFLGSLTAILVGQLFGKTVLRGQTTPFVMELPPYRWPTGKTSWFIFKRIIKLYLRRIGVVVLPFTIVIWFISNYPQTEMSSNIPSVETQSVEYSRQRETYLTMAGKYIEPVMRPLGFTVPMDVALISGLVAKEVVVATLGVSLTGEESPGEETLVRKLQNHIPSRAVALAFLVFVLLYTPCLMTIITIHRETKGWFWVTFSLLYQTALAYLGAFLTLHIAVMIGLG
ncbi:ferrous iron transport protein B [bacterium]|nr:ferrous iron transport protein B [bacterium]